jgi:hypothetical protein
MTAQPKDRVEEKPVKFGIPERFFSQHFDDQE